VSALGHKRVKRSHTTFVKKFVSDRKELVSVIVASFIRNDREHTLTRLDYIKRLLNDCSEGG
jgi:hypothetical protein